MTGNKAKSIFLFVSACLFGAHPALAECPGKTLSALPDYDIPAGVIVEHLQPGGIDPDGHPTSYKYKKEGQPSLFLPADKIELLSCDVKTHEPNGSMDTEYTMTFNPHHDDLSRR